MSQINQLTTMSHSVDLRKLELGLIYKGKTSREIAELLEVGKSTVNELRRKRSFSWIQSLIWSLFGHKPAGSLNRSFVSVQARKRPKNSIEYVKCLRCRLLQPLKKTKLSRCPSLWYRSYRCSSNRSQLTSLQNFENHYFCRLTQEFRCWALTSQKLLLLKLLFPIVGRR